MKDDCFISVSFNPIPTVINLSSKPVEAQTGHLKQFKFRIIQSILALPAA